MARFVLSNVSYKRISLVAIHSVERRMDIEWEIEAKAQKLVEVSVFVLDDTIFSFV